MCTLSQVLSWSRDMEALTIKVQKKGWKPSSIRRARHDQLSFITSLYCHQDGICMRELSLGKPELTLGMPTNPAFHSIYLNPQATRIVAALPRVADMHNIGPFSIDISPDTLNKCMAMCTARTEQTLLRARHA